jgi:hypothetical protein
LYRVERWSGPPEADVAGRGQVLRLRGRRADHDAVKLGFDRIVVSEGEAPNLFVTLVYHWLRVAAKR